MITMISRNLLKLSSIKRLNTAKFNKLVINNKPNTGSFNHQVIRSYAAQQT